MSAATEATQPTLLSGYKTCFEEPYLLLHHPPFHSTIEHNGTVSFFSKSSGTPITFSTSIT